MAETETRILVQICYATPERQELRDLEVAQGATIAHAIRESGLLEEFPEIDAAAMRAGIYGKLRPLDTLVRARDRIEIYRPLIADPKEARRRRALDSATSAAGRHRD